MRGKEEIIFGDFDVGNVRDIAGVVSGSLTAIWCVGVTDVWHRAMWLCWCECGHVCYRRSRDMVSGVATTCGCKRPNKKMVEYARRLERIVELSARGLTASEIAPVVGMKRLAVIKALQVRRYKAEKQAREAAGGAGEVMD